MPYPEISDGFWQPVEPLLERFKRKKSGGRPPLDFRVILNGIGYLLKTGCQWDCLPPGQGSKSAVHEHFQTGVAAGVFAEIFRLNAGLISPTLEADGLPRPTPTVDQPQRMCLDKGYDYRRVETEREVHEYIPHIRCIGEEKVPDGEKTYPARRWVVERTLAWMKGFRAIRTRYFCKAQNDLAMIHLACALILSRRLEAD